MAIDTPNHLELDYAKAKGGQASGGKLHNCFETNLTPVCSIPTPKAMAAQRRKEEKGGSWRPGKGKGKGGRKCIQSGAEDADEDVLQAEWD